MTSISLCYKIFVAQNWKKMRTSEIKIEGQKKEAVLVAGGPGFKVYTVSDLDGWAIAIGRKASFIADNTPAAQAVADYVNIRYHSLNLHESIKNKFNELVDVLKEKHEAPIKEAPIN